MFERDSATETRPTADGSAPLIGRVPVPRRRGSSGAARVRQPCASARSPAASRHAPDSFEGGARRACPDADDGVVVVARRERRERKTEPQVARRAVEFGVMIVTGTMAGDHVRSRSSLRPSVTSIAAMIERGHGNERKMIFRVVAV